MTFISHFELEIVKNIIYTSQTKKKINDNEPSTYYKLNEEQKNTVV